MADEMKTKTGRGGRPNHAMTEADMAAAREAMCGAQYALGLTYAEVGKIVGVTTQGARIWFLSGLVPAARVIPVFHALKGLVPFDVLRPDLYGRRAA